VLKLLKGGPLTTLEASRPRIGQNTFDCRIRELLSQKAVKTCLHGGPDWQFGASFTSDGHSLHVSVVNGAQAAVSIVRAAAAKAGNVAGKAARAAGNLYVTKLKHKSSGHAASSKRARSVKLEPTETEKTKKVESELLRLPLNTGFVGVDLGASVLSETRFWLLTSPLCSCRDPQRLWLRRRSCWRAGRLWCKAGNAHGVDGRFPPGNGRV
jgi:hypothetical protein